MNSIVRRHSIIAHWVSVTVHAVVISLACMFGAPQALWQANVSRGRSSLIVVSIPSPNSVAQPLSVSEPVPVEIETEPVQREKQAPPRPPEQVVPKEVDASQPIDEVPLLTESELPIRSVPPPEMPRVSELPVERPKKKPTITPSLAASASPPPITSPAGADFDTPPTKLPENKPPVYPHAAHLSGHEGRVVLVVTVNHQGSVTQIGIESSSGYASLDSAAVEAVQQWRFSPATLQGAAVKAEILVPIRFTISTSS